MIFVPIKFLLLHSKYYFLANIPVFRTPAVSGIYPAEFCWKLVPKRKGGGLGCQWPAWSITVTVAHCNTLLPLRKFQTSSKYCFYTPLTRARNFQEWKLSFMERFCIVWGLRLCSTFQCIDQINLPLLGLKWSLTKLCSFRTSYFKIYQEV